VKVSSDGGAYAYTTYYMWIFYASLHRLGEDIGLGSGVVGDISGLGAVVVGAASPHGAVRWDGVTPTPLGDFPGGGSPAEALAVSDSGEVIAGRGTTAAGSEAFLWTAESGTRRLADVLTEHGLDVSGWALEQATGLSASGRTVVGWGTNPSGDTEGFVATLPAAAAPAPSVGPFGLVLLGATILAAASAAVRRGQRRNTSPATR
jgi:hypothetical protein